MLDLKAKVAKAGSPEARPMGSAIVLKQGNTWYEHSKAEGFGYTTPFRARLGSCLVVSELLLAV
jgi:hypothetical protein